MALNQISGNQIASGSIEVKHLKGGKIPADAITGMHTHKVHSFVVAGQAQTTIEFASLGSSDITDTTFKVTDEVDVYVNGVLQVKDTHFTVTEDAANEYMTAIELTSAAGIGDNVVLKWTKY